MPKISVNDAKTKYKSGVQGGANAYTVGINSVSVAPSQKAIAQQQKMVTNWNNAITSGKWAEKLNAVTLSSWKSSATGMGAQNYVASADKGATKWGVWATESFPIIQAIQDEIEAMPSTTFQDNIQRMIYNVTEMSNRLG